MEASELQKQVPAAAIMALPASGTHLASNQLLNVPQQLFDWGLQLKPGVTRVPQTH